MPTSFEAILVLLIGILPGALYIWSFERLAGRWGIGLSDRVFRFVGASAAIHAVLGPASYWLWSTKWPQLALGGSSPFWIWLIAGVYVGAPFAAGALVGWGTRKRYDWAHWLTGPDPAPRAWDYLFQGERDGWIRLKLKSGTWVGGAYATHENLKSYSSGYPEAPDLFLARAVELDPSTGEFTFEQGGEPLFGSGGLLVRWDEVEYLEFIDA